MKDEKTSRSIAAGFRRLFEPIAIGNFSVRNRIVNTTHGTGLGSARDLRYIQERARGGSGMIGIHSGQGVYGYGLGQGTEQEMPAWDEKALSPVSDRGIAFYDKTTIHYLQEI